MKLHCHRLAHAVSDFFCEMSHLRFAVTYFAALPANAYDIIDTL